MHLAQAASPGGNFYPRSPCGERLYHNLGLLSNHTFLSTLSLRRATVHIAQDPSPGRISIHALLAESDPPFCVSVLPIRGFLSTLSLRRATTLQDIEYFPALFLSTLSLRRATRAVSPFSYRSLNFYPRSPCGERQNENAQQGGGWQFLSTLSLRRATQLMAANNVTPEISIHALLAESDEITHAKHRAMDISIHALLAESDTRKVHDWINGAISIHALLAESDLTQDLPIWRRPYFYPRSPCGERQNHNIRIIVSKAFLSTLSLRRATYFSGVMRQNPGISIHALLAESDDISLTRIIGFLEFLSTLSLRRATLTDDVSTGGKIFLSTLSLRRATPMHAMDATPILFLSTLSLRRATG